MNRITNNIDNPVRFCKYIFFADIFRFNLSKDMHKELFDTGPQPQKLKSITSYNSYSIFNDTIFL